MSVRQLVRRPSKPAVPRERKPRRNRSGRFLLLTIGSGVIAALLAIAIEGLPLVMAKLLPPSQPSQINASSLFPSPGPTHKTVDVYDPPPQQAPRPSPSPTHRPSPSPSPSRSPRPRPSASPSD